MTEPSIVGVSGSVTRPSRTTALVQAILDGIQARNGGVPKLIELVDSAETQALVGEREARVRAALEELSREQALVLRLSFYMEKPHAEIARELGIPLGTVKSRVRLAMGKIRVMLENER